MNGQDCWLIVGASSAIARDFARLAAADGADIILAGRDRADLDASAADLRVRFSVRAEVGEFAAEDEASHARLLNRAATFAGPVRLNILVAFGLMPLQAEIDSDLEWVRQVIDVNFTGAAQFLHLAAPLFEARRAGRIAVLGSVAGDRGRISNYVYGAAKAGLHTYLQGLRARMVRVGVTVTTIKPGPVDTAMTFGVKNLPLMAPPLVVARIAYRAALKGADQVYAPGVWRWIMALVCAVPERIFKKLNV